MKKASYLIFLLILVALIGVYFINKDHYLDGKITEIETIKDGVKISIETDNGKVIKAYVDNETYIGNATMNPPKPISFLEVEMGGNFVIKMKIGKMYVKSMNLYF